jgi:hypothetical protein
MVSGWEFRGVRDFGNYLRAFTTESRRDREKQNGKADIPEWR